METIPTLETGRLRLRPFALADADNVHRLVSAAEVAATAISIPHPYPEEAAASWIATHAPNAAAGGSFAWAVTDRVDGTLYGAIELHVTPAHRRGEIGYWAGVPYWNRGITSEAAIHVVEHAFSMLGLHRIQATCRPGNRGSSRVMEKAGLTFEGTLRGHVLNHGVFEDSVIYGLIRPEWEATRGRSDRPSP